ncbi:uncharacterized protein LOC115751165 [Rhodamnia argentea]|uniref:Uncharacterized protein LOC115751165 n=1 Tax=Rhodamnia argentea TaxID=178133 RepID=A0A8B8QF05_9MYRT|nr:uncharacterized protein LOC115751165 [Rhodamnia argentea]
MVHRERRRHRRQPCLYCHPQSYIRMVQHLIERCLVFHMTRDDCIQALAKHASAQPVVTLTVWEELLNKNKSFFQVYYRVVPQSHPEYKPSERFSEGTQQIAMR